MKSLLRDRELLLDKVSSLLYSLLDPKYSIFSYQQALNNVKNNQVLYLRLGFPEIRLSESAKNHEDLAWFFLQLCLLHPCRPWNKNAMQIYLTWRETFAFLSLSRKRILKSCSLASYFSGSLALPTPVICYLTVCALNNSALTVCCKPNWSVVFVSCWPSLTDNFMSCRPNNWFIQYGRIQSTV